jgi:hypothetical protein
MMEIMKMEMDAIQIVMSKVGGSAAVDQPRQAILANI